MSFNSFDFRKTLSRFATGIAVVLASDTEKRFHGVTVNSLTSVSLDPPLILFCLKSASESCALLQKSEKFSLNILAKNQASLARRFATREQKICKEEELIATSCGIFKLAGCVAHLYCQRQTIIPGGDHEIFLCRVIGLESDEIQDPLIFYQSRFGAAEIFPLGK